MPQDQPSTALSRRRFVQRSAATAGAAAVATAAATAAAAPARSAQRGQPAPGSTLVAATVVRAAHAKHAPGALTLGVRASILTPGGGRTTLVVVVEPVDFGLPTAEINNLIAEAVRAKTASLQADRDGPVAPGDIVVQVFGRAL